MKIEKLRSKLKKAFNRAMGVLLPVATLFVSCGTNALVVHAAESSVLHFVSQYYDYKNNIGEKDEVNITVPAGTEICGVITKMVRSDDDLYNELALYTVGYGSYSLNGNKWGRISSIPGYEVICTSIKDGKEGNIFTGNTTTFKYQGLNSEYIVNFSFLSGNIKVFDSLDEMKNYISTGTGDYDIIKPDELEKGWYLKNVSYKVTADDSPSSEAGADATYIHFSWDIDNLQDGDLLEIKTKSYYKKILGEQLSGFHDFITKSDGVSAYEGKYSFSQYEATKAWFNSLENKPLVFKEYDTTDYYLRPYRQGQYGGWVHIKMGRSTPTSSPYIEDIEYGDFDDDNNWTVDEDLTDKNGGHHGVDQGGGYIPPDQSDNPFTGTNIAGIFSYFYDFMKQIPAMLGDLPALVGNIISFLPKPIIAFIGIGVIVAIILRIVGR